MFDGITSSQWLAVAAIAAAGAGIIGLVRKRRGRYALLCTWVLMPLLLAMCTSSLDDVESVSGQFVLYLFLPTLPWSVLSAGGAIGARLALRLLGARRGTKSLDVWCHDGPVFLRCPSPAPGRAGSVTTVMVTGEAAGVIRLAAVPAYLPAIVN